VKFDRAEFAGAVADLGVFVPIAVALIVSNGLSATAVLLPAGLLYVTAALVYHLPVPVQPLKAFGAIAIAKGLGSDEIAAGALLMGAMFLLAGRLRILDVLARAFPRALVRGVQLTVGLLFLKISWGLVTDPPKSFAAHALDVRWALPLGVFALVLALTLRRYAISIALVGTGVVVALVLAGGQLELGPSALTLPSLDGGVLLTALTVLVLPQAPLSFANSCLATADAARVYFGKKGERVRPGRLATSFGTANLLAGAVSGMPVCHGAGGMTAHYKFGARTGAAPLVMGTALLFLAVVFGAGLAGVLPALPLPILAGLLATAGVLHITLLRDLQGARDWALALLVGGIGFELNLMWALAAGLAAWWIPYGFGRLQARLAEATP
jgi:SulP family sulfate permease